jgi:hypothetical protein
LFDSQKIMTTINPVMSLMIPKRKGMDRLTNIATQIYCKAKTVIRILKSSLTMMIPAVMPDKTNANGAMLSITLKTYIHEC